MKLYARFRRLLLLLFVCLLPAVEADADAPGPTVNIVMVLWRGETDAERGFRDGLRARGYRADISILNASQNRTTLATQIRRQLSLLRSDADYIYSFGTSATRMVRQLVAGQTPHIFNIVTDPEGAGIISPKPGENTYLAGISHHLSLESQLEQPMRLKNIRHIAFLFNPRERNSELLRQEMQRVAQKYHLRVTELRCPPDSGRLSGILQRLAAGSPDVDAVYLPMDSYLLSQAALIGRMLGKAGIFSIGAQRRYIEAGVLIGLVPNYYELGRVAAHILDRHRQGEKLSSMPVYHAQTRRLLINESSRRQLGLKLPESLRSMAVRIR